MVDLFVVGIDLGSDLESEAFLFWVVLGSEGCCVFGYVKRVSLCYDPPCHYDITNYKMSIRICNNPSHRYDITNYKM